MPETGSPAHSVDAFRRALGSYATGVTVITTQSDGQLAGLTANSFTSVSLRPPLILFCISRTSQSLPVFLGATHFAVNVLASDQVQLASRFASSGGNKFSSFNWRPGRGSSPLLQGVAATFECRMHSTIDAGDHMVMLGEVEHFSRFSRPILLFAHGRFGLAVDYSEPVTEKKLCSG